MTSNKNLVLIGMMGSGKSTIGAFISHKLNFDFIDTDREIEKNENQTIKKIFETKNETYFRSVEKKIVLEKIKLSKKIIALGGGAYLNSEIRKKLKKDNLVFWMYWNNSTLISRIFKNKKRPKADYLSKNELHNMINKRNLVYKNANFKIDCEKLDKNQIAEKIIKIYENEKA